MLIDSYGAPATYSYSANARLFLTRPAFGRRGAGVRCNFRTGSFRQPVAWQAAFDLRRPGTGGRVIFVVWTDLWSAAVGCTCSVHPRPGFADPRCRIHQRAAGDLPAALAGTLIDEKAEMKEISPALWTWPAGRCGCKERERSWMGSVRVEIIFFTWKFRQNGISL